MEKEPTLPWPEEESSTGEKPRGPSAKKTETVLSVSEVNRLAKQSLERITVSVQGEVSGLNTRYPYYVYMDLRDSEAALPAILQKRLFEGLDFKMEDGTVVVVRGTLSLFERQGKYQIRVAEIRPYGEGEIQRRIEALKRKLQSEGLFEDARKKPLPLFPQRIGVVTSPRGAAIRDVTATIARRFPPASVFVRGVRVQGEGAVAEICGALEFFDTVWPVDLIVLTRGGGSIQDLEPFSTEEVARTIARMKVPVVTGIGHEPDVSIADLVADLRASTPTAAAEACVPDRADVKAMLGKVASGLRRHAGTEKQAAVRHLNSLKRLPLYRSPEFLMGRFLQRFERASQSLPQSPARGLVRSRNRLAILHSRPVFKLPGELLYGSTVELSSVKARLELAGIRVIERETGTLERIKARATALSPLAVLERGYSITFNRESGAVVRAPDDVGMGAPLRIKLAGGDLEAEVTGKE